MNDKHRKNKEINIGIIGAGSWGTTLAVLLAKKCYNIFLWTRSEDTYRNILNFRKNFKYTGDLHIPENVTPFSEISDFGNRYYRLVILAIPSQFLREIISKFHNMFEINCDNIECLLNVAKGIETKTNLRLSQVLELCLPGQLKTKIGILSGPNIASEIARGLPSVSVISSKNFDMLKCIQPIISDENFRIYTNSDIVGVEIGGAVKNIIALASGISDGLGYGANTKASLITRGLYEISKIGIKLGAKMTTFSGAAGMGDLIATCISNHSRNRSVGERIAKGEKVNDILNSMHMVAEGIKTTESVYDIANCLEIDTPIINGVYEIIYRNLDPKESVEKLMTRKFKSEIEDI